MTEDELVEQLGRKLASIWYGAPEPFAYSLSWEKMTIQGRDHFRVLAKECLRQMRWASREGAGWNFEPETFSLAPEGWDPEAGLTLKPENG